MTKWAAVIGSPIDHSLSPVLHKTAYALLGLPWDYRKFDVTVEGLPAFLETLGEECVGLSVTAPLKREIMAHGDAVDGLAKMVQSANTLVFGTVLSAAFNTDVHGIVETLKPHIALPPKEVDESLIYGGPTLHEPRDLVAEVFFDEDEFDVPVVFGTGATASSAMAALKTLGFEKVYLVGRRFSGPENAFMRAVEVGLDVAPIPIGNESAVKRAVAFAPVVISTVPPHVATSLSEGLVAREGAVLLDVTYQDGVSGFARIVEAAGGTVTSPLTMLTHQGLAQVKLMTNREAPFEPVEEAVMEAAKAR